MTASTDKIALGDVVRDTITGFQGVAIGITHWLHGCGRVVVQPQDLKDGKPIDAMTFDELQLEIVAKGKHAPKPLPKSEPTGGPWPDAIRR
jgi:hypothetical protein